jgi:hypothetical protein
MNIDTPVRGQIENIGTKNLTEGSDNDEVGCPGMKLIHGFGFAQSVGLNNWKAERLSQGLDGGRSQKSSPSGRLVGLGDNTYNRIMFSKCLQGGNGEIGRTHEDDFSGHMSIVSK